jgi:PHD/YefM family antitoxin component YafN of YafNO toxin-antitoxin module
MKPFTAVQAEADIDKMLDSAQKERIVIMRGGKPSAVVVGVESYDEEDLELAASPEFWRMIETRRQRGTSIPLSELRARLSCASSPRTKTKKKSRGP